MGTKSTRSCVALLALVLIPGVTIAAVPATNSAPTSVTAGSSAENAGIAQVETIGDDQLHDCLTRIGEFPEALEGTVSPTPAFDDLARLKAELYFKYPDLQGFLFAPDNASLNEPEGVATLSVPVERESASSFGAVWSEVTALLNTSHVVLEQREGNGSVREVCAVFLDALGSEELSAHIEGAAIDQLENTVVIFARDADYVAAYAARAYGDLARIEATEGAHEESRSWSAGPFPAGQRAYNPGGAWWCTQGFNMRNANGTPFTTTAAHCGGVGQQWHSAGYIGATTNHLPGRDVAFVFGGSYTNQMYRGSWNTSATGTVLGALSGLPNPGNYAGYSGATTGESSASYAYSGCHGEYCNLLFFNGHNTANGDSGGPWFARIGSSANTYAVAIHRGYLGNPANVMMATDVRYVLSATSSTMM